MFLIQIMLVGSDPSTGDLKAVEYAPLTGDDWKLSTQAGTGSDACDGAGL